MDVKKCSTDPYFKNSFLDLRKAEDIMLLLNRSRSFFWWFSMVCFVFNALLLVELSKSGIFSGTSLDIHYFWNYVPSLRYMVEINANLLGSNTSFFFWFITILWGQNFDNTAAFGNGYSMAFFFEKAKGKYNNEILL